MSRSARLACVIDLALRDFLHEWRMSMCAVLGVAVVLAPLLVFFGLKYGIVSALTERLASDPRNLELRIVGQGLYTEDWFATLWGRADVAFTVPNTRFLAATLSLRRPSHPDRPIATVEVVPTAAGDPLLQGQSPVPERFDTVVLSQSAAEKLRAAVGTVLTGVVGRAMGDVRESRRLELTVIGVLPAGYYQRDAAFVSLPLLLALEQFREGYAVADLGWPGLPLPTGPRTYASFRLYAKSIDDVGPLRDWLASPSRGVTSHTRAAEIEALQQLDRNLTALFVVLAVLSGAGFVLLMLVSQWAAVIRKQRHLSVLRLLGFSTGALALYPMVQAAASAICGTGLAIGLYFAIEPVTNGLFVEQWQIGAAVSRLLPGHMLLALLITLACTLLAASVAAWRAALVPPAEGLRDE